MMAMAWKLRRQDRSPKRFTTNWRKDGQVNTLHNEKRRSQTYRMNRASGARTEAARQTMERKAASVIGVRELAKSGHGGRTITLVNKMCVTSRSSLNTVAASKSGDRCLGCNSAAPLGAALGPDKGARRTLAPKTRRQWAFRWTRLRITYNLLAFGVVPCDAMTPFWTLI
jgi:hypothetical protein